MHRIDKNTSGLLVVAKNEEAHARLARQFFDHSIQRRYVALVWGNFDEDEGTITGNIGRSPHDRQKMYVFADGEQGKHAVTHWRVLRRYGYVTLVECRLETGRTHQIRVHLASIGHPLVGDTVYGAKKPVPGLAGQCLHARRLRFVHPASGELVELECPLPDWFQEILRKIDR